MHSVINFDKPKGMTSQQAVTAVKKRLREKKAGHSGTLDPMATGVLLVCIGEATKISSHLMGMQKTYEAGITLGSRTDTLDAEGEVLEQREVAQFSLDEIHLALNAFRGVIRQTPPMYSALKRDGRPLYELAREGKTVERKEREVTIYDIEMTGYDHPVLNIRVSCSKGTYIRTLAEDIAGRLGTIAHLSSLRRTRVGGFDVADAVGLDELEGLAGSSAGALPGAVVSVDAAMSAMQEIVLSQEDFDRVRHGGFASPAAYGINGSDLLFRLKGPDGELFAIGSSRGGRIKVDRIFHLKG